METTRRTGTRTKYEREQVQEHDDEKVIQKCRLFITVTIINKYRMTVYEINVDNIFNHAFRDTIPRKRRFVPCLRRTDQR